MKLRLNKLLNRETVTYLVFGVLTTLVDWASFWLLKKWLGTAQLMIQLANAIAFVLAATFAYVTNKCFVFESRSWAWKVLRKEIPLFFGARIASWLFTALGLWFAEQVLHAQRFSLWFVDGIMLAKILLSVVVVVVNYVFSKLLIFRKK